MDKNQLNEALAWLIENPSESIAVASRFFNVLDSTLRSSITRASNTQVSYGGHNRVLLDT